MRIKRIIELLLIAAFLSVVAHAAPIAGTLTLKFTWVPAPVEMAGLSTNAYATNIAFALLSTTDVTVPIAQWPIVGTYSCQSFITNQGPVGTLWTNQFNTDGSSRFYVLQVSNTTSGTVSPFSNQKPWFQPSQSGIIQSVLSP